MATVKTAGTAFSLYNSNNGVLPVAADEMLFKITAHDQDTFFETYNGPIYEVQGYLSDEFSYSSQAQYDNITTPVAPDHLLYKMLKDETQRSIATYGYMTKKTYSNSSSQSLTIKFRSVAHNRKFLTCVATNSKDKTYTTNPKDIAKVLMSLTMNTVGKNALFNFTSPAKTTVGAAVKNALTPVGNFVNAAANVTMAPFGIKLKQDEASTTQPVAPIPADHIEEKTAVEYTLDMLTVKNPLVVRLQIGNIFDKDYMVVKSVDVTFSKEFYNTGIPLYADFTVTLESLFNSSNQVDLVKEQVFGTGFSVRNDFKVVVE